MDLQEAQKTDLNESEREKLRAIQVVFEQAVASNNIEALRPHTDPEFSYVSFTDRSFADFDAFSKQWDLTRKEMVGNGSFTTQLNPQPSLFLGDIAVCTGNSENTMVDKRGQSFTFSSHWTVVMKKSAGDWKVLRAHNSLDPFSNPMLVHAVKSKVLQTGALAFIVGGALCSLLSYLVLG
ncbi:MAG: DUF4440 domain-containing protein [Gammaproteobacteria bacterium]|nr:DUF4440 domain-containing protein [Gammaproteobacteria bacterium]MDH5803157.1 DUF4440 domain-containing protein [Gammaproteobacteria bacterium]